MDTAQAQQEAKSKILWGDPPEEATRYLMMHGFSREEATELVREMIRERAAMVRGTGIGKILTGLGMMAVPIVALIIFLIIGIIPITLFAIVLGVGLWGAWKVVNGIIMALAPRAEQGELAD